MPIKLHVTVWQRQNVLSWRDSNADPSVSYADAKNHCAIPLGPNIDIDIAQLTPFKLKQFLLALVEWRSGHRTRLKNRRPGFESRQSIRF
jgi:hypothetical protein